MGISLLTTLPLALACSILSVFVVLRRWAFIGEGIAHAGFGGAGTAWMAALLLPQIGFLAAPAGVYAVCILFSLIVGLLIAYITRRGEVHTDTAIGIFLVASLAWGFVGQSIHRHVRNTDPPFWAEALFGAVGTMDGRFAVAALAMAAAVLLACALLGKELLAYAFDPALAEISGVRVGAVHYLLILLVTMTILIGLRLMGAVLVTALLVLPGATGLLVGRKLRDAFAVSAIVAVVAGVVGPAVSWKFNFLHGGPVIVLLLVLEFLVAWLWTRLPTRRAALI